MVSGRPTVLGSRFAGATPAIGPVVGSTVPMLPVSCGSAVAAGTRMALALGTLRTLPVALGLGGDARLPALRVLHRLGPVLAAPPSSGASLTAAVPAASAGRVAR